ncbi:MAG: glycosyltransferase family 4 protein [Actinomycetota bacterium]
MRVALVGPFPLGRHVDGGIETVMSELVAAIARVDDDVSVHVVTVGPPPVDSTDAVTVVRPRRFARWTWYRGERRDVAAAIERIAPDVVHVHGLNFYAASMGGFQGPVVMTPHGMLAHEARIVDAHSGVLERWSKRLRGVGNLWFERRALRRAEHLTAINAYVREVLGSRTSATWFDVSNPTPPAYFDLPDRSGRDRLLFVGAIEPRKAVIDLVAAVASVLQAEPAVTLRVVGSDRDVRYADEVRAVAATSPHSDRITFDGPLGADEVLDAYRDSDVVVLSSVEETSPLVLQQAMAGGRAVVATSAGGISHMIRDGETGRLVPPGDRDALANTLFDVIRQPRATDRMIERARRVAGDRFHPDAVAAATLDVYRRVRR